MKSLGKQFNFQTHAEMKQNLSCLLFTTSASDEVITIIVVNSQSFIIAKEVFIYQMCPLPASLSVSSQVAHTYVYFEIHSA